MPIECYNLLSFLQQILQVMICHQKVGKDPLSSQQLSYQQKVMSQLPPSIWQRSRTKTGKDFHHHMKLQAIKPLKTESESGNSLFPNCFSWSFGLLRKVHLKQQREAWNQSIQQHLLGPYTLILYSIYWIYIREYTMKEPLTCLPSWRHHPPCSERTGVGTFSRLASITLHTTAGKKDGTSPIAGVPNPKVDGQARLNPWNERKAHSRLRLKCCR